MIRKGRKNARKGRRKTVDDRGSTRFEPPASKRSSERSGDNGGGEPVRSAPAGTRWTGDVPSRDETDAVPLLTDCSRGVVAVEETTGVDDPHPMRATDLVRKGQKWRPLLMMMFEKSKKLKDRTRSKFDRQMRFIYHGFLLRKCLPVDE